MSRKGVRLREMRAVWHLQEDPSMLQEELMNFLEVAAVISSFPTVEVF